MILFFVFPAETTEHYRLRYGSVPYEQLAMRTCSIEAEAAKSIGNKSPTLQRILSCGINKQFTPPNCLDRLQEILSEVSWRRLETEQIVGFPSGAVVRILGHLHR